MSDRLAIAGLLRSLAEVVETSGDSLGITLPGGATPRTLADQLTRFRHLSPTYSPPVSTKLIAGPVCWPMFAETDRRTLVGHIRHEEGIRLRQGEIQTLRSQIWPWPVFKLLGLFTECSDQEAGTVSDVLTRVRIGGGLNLLPNDRDIPLSAYSTWPQLEQLQGITNLAQDMNPGLRHQPTCHVPNQVEMEVTRHGEGETTWRIFLIMALMGIGVGPDGDEK